MPRPAPHRDVIIAMFRKGMSSAAIADTVGRSKDAVRATIKKARAAGELMAVQPRARVNKPVSGSREDMTDGQLAWNEQQDRLYMMEQCVRSADAIVAVYGKAYGDKPYAYPKFNMPERECKLTWWPSPNPFIMEPQI